MLKYVLRFLGILLLLVLLALGFVAVVTTTPWGERFVTKQANSYLAKKLKTPFRVGRIAYRIPDWVLLEDVYFQTPKGDTLLAGQTMRVDLDMLDLVQGKITLNQVELSKIRLYLDRRLPDTTFNFQFLINAFDTGKPKPVDTTAAPLDLSLDALALNDVRIRYYDDVTGLDTRAYVDTLRAQFGLVDVDRSRYHLDSVFVNGLGLNLRVFKGVAVAETASKPANPADTLDLQLGTWRLARTRWNVVTEEAGFNTNGTVGRLALAAESFSLAKQNIVLRSVELKDSDIAAVLEKRPTKPATKTVKTVEAPTADLGWRARVGSLTLANNRLRFDDQAQAPQRRGLDYAHLDVKDLHLGARNLTYSPERISGSFRGGRFREKSGLVLQRLNADALYSERLISVDSLLLQTGTAGRPGTLLRDGLALRFDSLAQLSQPRFAKKVAVTLRLRQSQLAVADVLDLVPALESNPFFAQNKTAVLRANARVSGTLAALNVPQFEVNTGTGTRLNVRGKLTNVTDPQRLGLDLTVPELTTTQTDLARFLPKGTLPNTVALPPKFSLTGRLRGTLNALSPDLALRTDWGTARFDGTLKNFVTGKGQAYAGTAVLTDFDAGKWLKNEKQFGKITANATVDGRGLDVKTMDTKFRLALREATLNGYRYQNLDANGTLAGGILALRGDLADPNARLALDTRVDLRPAYPSVAGTVNIAELDLRKLGFYKDSLRLRGEIVANFSSTNPANPQGRLTARNAVINLNGKSYPVDSLYLAATTEGNRKRVVAETPFARLTLDGQFEYDRLGDIFTGEIRKYIDLPQLTFKQVPPPYDFTVKATVFQDSLLRAFAPGLTRLDTLRLDAYLDNTKDTSLSATLTSGIIEYDSSVVDGTTLTVRAAGDRLALTGRVNAVTSGSIRLKETVFNADALGNQVRFRVASRDSVGDDRHGLAGRVTFAGENFQLRVAPNGLLTNYRRWTSDSTGFLQYGPAGVLADRFILRSGDQALLLNTAEGLPNAPIEIKATNLNLSELARIANQDTALVGGRLNGDVVLRDFIGEDNALRFLGDLRVDSLRVTGQPLGTLAAKFANAGERISVETTLSGPSNDVRVTGFYNPTNAARALDFKIALARLDARTVEAFSFGQLRRARGALRGDFTVAGAVSKPQVEGSLVFDSVAYNIAQNNATYLITGETLRFADQTITFNDFDLRDTLGRALTVNGTVSLQKLPDVAYDLRVNADKFTVLNASRRDNDYAYGNATVSTSLRIQGSGGSPAVTGSLKLDEGSKVSVVLPDQGPGANEAREVVTFIDHNDTLALRKYLVPKRDSALPRLAFQELSNSQINLTLLVDDKSELRLVIDELNGDNLRVNGNANLNVSLNASGEVSVVGRFDVTEGEYSLTYQVLKRQFTLQKGGFIQFTGDPLKADLNLTAVYSTIVAPAALVGAQLSGNSSASAYNVKIPFDVKLTMSGNLATPQLTFDIVVPNRQGMVVNQTVKQAVEGRLGQLRQDPSQLNKQVFALLVLNGFLPENPTDFFSGGGGGGTGLAAENIARSSVSKILSQQLEKFASSVIKGVDVNFDLQSANDYQSVTSGTGANRQTAGVRGGRTDLNVGLSKSFLDGRLSVSVGKNFVLENTTGAAGNSAEVFDNLSINYNLSRDGRYAVRAYRLNQFNSGDPTAVIDGFIVETGVAFVITVEYNLLRELFRRKREGEGGLF